MRRLAGENLIETRIIDISSLKIKNLLWNLDKLYEMAGLRRDIVSESMFFIKENKKMDYTTYGFRGPIFGYDEDAHVFFESTIDESYSRALLPSELDKSDCAKKYSSVFHVVTQDILEDYIEFLKSTRQEKKDAPSLKQFLQDRIIMKNLNIIPAPRFVQFDNIAQDPETKISDLSRINLS